jgi:hypothetical protein
LLCGTWSAEERVRQLMITIGELVVTSPRKDALLVPAAALHRTGQPRLNKA